MPQRTRPLARPVTTVLAVVAVAFAACSKAGESPAPTSSAAAVAPASVGATPGPTTARPGDSVPTAGGELRITPLHHATLLLGWQGKSYFVDPFHEASFRGLPKADVVFITDIHPDHLDATALASVTQPSTIIVAPPAVVAELPKELTHVVPLKNGETETVLGVGVEAIPMYNLRRGPAPGKLFHDKGRGDGFVLTFGDKRVYLSGDTECTDEMRALKNIDVAFVCMNLPYTMTPGEAATCVKAFRPKVVYPYHYRDSNLAEFTGPLAGEHDIEVRERSWY
jgi:L-ascorbate metabolism protein UlaG (beta-lactamase superfamily)